MIGIAPLIYAGIGPNGVVVALDIAALVANMYSDSIPGLIWGYMKGIHVRVFARYVS